MSKYKNPKLTEQDSGFSEIFEYEFDPSLCLHENLVNAAHSDLMKTEHLIDFATAVIKHEWNGNETNGNKALLILQERATEEVFEKLKLLITSKLEEERVLGFKVLRESKLSKSESKYHLEILNLLDQAAKVEKDDAILTWIVSAIGWNHTSKTKKYLHQFVNHPLEGVRFGVAAGWINGCQKEDPFPSDIAQIAEILCQDKDSDNRWYSYSNLVDIAEYWGLKSGANVAKYNQLICAGFSDPDPGIVHLCKLAIAHQKNNNIWTGDCDYALMDKTDYLKYKKENIRDKNYSDADYEIASNVYERFDER